MDRCCRWLSYALIALALSGCVRPSQSRDTLYQISTLQALMEGAYDGVVTVAELRRHGDLGLGTFEGLNGEMVVLDGRVYQARSDGRVVRVPDEWLTPFATVAAFCEDRRADVQGPVDMAGLAEALDAHLTTLNLFHIVRIDGRFEYVRVRSVPGQAPPYRPLAEVAREQSVWELHDVEGTLVALRCPAYAAGLNMAGWHMHFLTNDRRRGGHVLDLRADRVTARIDQLERFEMVLPQRGRFVEADLTRSSAEEIRSVEQ